MTIEFTHVQWGLNLPQVRFVTGRVERTLDRLLGVPDVVVLDSLRRGAGREVAAFPMTHHVECVAVLAR